MVKINDAQTLGIMKKKVLIVSQNVPWMMWAAAELEKRSYSISVSTQRVSLSNELDSINHDLVICDLHHSRAEIEHCLDHKLSKPVILLTDLPFVLDFSEETSNLTVLQKPVTLPVLLQAVKQFFRVIDYKNITEINTFQKQLYDSIQDIVIVIDGNYNIVRTNRALLLHMGIEQNEVARNAFMDVIGEKCYSTVFKRNEPCHRYGDCCPLLEISQGKNYSESVIVRENQYHSVIMTPLSGEDQTPTHYVEIIRDISVQKNAEKALEFRIRLENLIDRLSMFLIQLAPEKIDEGIQHALEKIAVFTNSEHSYLMEWNLRERKWTITHEWNAGTFREQNPIIQVDVVNLTRWSPFRKKLIDNKETLLCQSVPLLPESEKINYFVQNHIQSICLVPIQYGENLYRVLGFESRCFEYDWSADIFPMFKIIGEIFGSTIARARKEIALQHSEARYRRLTENAPDLIWRISLNGELEYVNPMIFEILGYTRKEALRAKLDQFLPLSIRERLKQILSSIGKNPKKTSSIQFEDKLKHKSGRLVPCEVNLTVDRNPAGKIIAFEGILRDLTERKRIEMEKAELQSKLFQAQKMEAVGSLASSIAHEINNPIGIILGFAEYLQDNMNENDPHRDSIDLIYKESLRIKEITGRMMEFIRAGDITLRLIDINIPVKECFELMAHKLQQSKVEISLELQENLPAIKGNINALKQVFINLILNSLEAMPENRRGKIWAGSSLKNPEIVQVIIRDNGSGIPDHAREEVFKPFRTLKKQGTGLGLAITSSIIEEHHGHIRFESEVEQGTIFIVEFPVYKASPNNNNIADV